MVNFSFENWSEWLTFFGVGAAVSTFLMLSVKKWARTRGEKQKDLAEGAVSTMRAHSEEATILEMTIDIHKKQLHAAYEEVDRVTNNLFSLKKEFEVRFNDLWAEIQPLKQAFQAKISENNDLKFKCSILSESLADLIDFVKENCKVDTRRWEEILKNNSDVRQVL